MEPVTENRENEPNEPVEILNQIVCDKCFRDPGGQQILKYAQSVNRAAENVFVECAFTNCAEENDDETLRYIRLIAEKTVMSTATGLDNAIGSLSEVNLSREVLQLELAKRIKRQAQKLERKLKKYIKTVY